MHRGRPVEAIFTYFRDSTLAKLAVHTVERRQDNLS